MQAVIFDVDGTLLDSFESDSGLYVAAIRRVLGEVKIRDEWHEYQHVSDTGILADVCKDNSCHYDDAVSESVCAAFLEMLSAHMSQHGCYREVPGALKYFGSLQCRSDVQVAYATGGWRASAELKLRSAGFPLRGIPLATANDHCDRRQIMRHALLQLRGPFESVTYFGDGPWDQSATADLGWRFVPVGSKLSGIQDFGAVSVEVLLSTSVTR